LASNYIPIFQDASGSVFTYSYLYLTMPLLMMPVTLPEVCCYHSYVMTVAGEFEC